MTRGAVTAAFFRALPANGFVPPEADVPADLPGADRAAASAAWVAAFAVEFWSLPAAERVIRWCDLKATAFGPAAVRLTELQAGTCVEPVPQADAAALAALVKELVALPPRARAARRFDWLAARAAELRRWRAASRVVLRTDLSLAALEPRLFEALAAGRALAGVLALTDADVLAADRDRKARRQKWVDLVFGVAMAGVVAFVLLVAAGYHLRSQPKPWRSKSAGPPPAGATLDLPGRNGT